MWRRFNAVNKTFCANQKFFYNRLSFKSFTQSHIKYYFGSYSLSLYKVPFISNRWRVLINYNFNDGLHKLPKHQKWLRILTRRFFRKSLKIYGIIIWLKINNLRRINCLNKNSKAYDNYNRVKTRRKLRFFSIKLSISV